MTRQPSVAAQAIAGLFRLWQLTFSVILPPSCRFTPSCSAYGIAAVKRHGALAGGWLTLKRLGRCHPWGGQGFDPVPECSRQSHSRPPNSRPANSCRPHSRPPHTHPGA